VKRVPEIVPGYPDLILPINPDAEKKLKKRTLTNLYNQKPAWLVKAHDDLDGAVAASYGWSADISNEEALARLLELNNVRAAKQAAADKIRQRHNKSPTPAQLRREPPLPPMSIAGATTENDEDHSSTSMNRVCQ
jgi:hypothetical protein